MAIHILSPLFFFFFFFFFSILVALDFEPAAPAEEPVVPSFAFSWLDDKDTFEAGNVATIKIKVLGNFDSKGNHSLDKSAFHPTVAVNGKMGNSSFISGVTLELGADTDLWRVVFIPIRTGLFNFFIIEDRFRVLDSSLHFTVLPGKMYPAVSVVSWKGLVHEFQAGTKAKVLILPKDAFGNNISTTSQEPNSSTFGFSAFYGNGSTARVLNVTFLGWNKVGFVRIEFVASTSGSLLLHVEGGNQTLNGSPLPFNVTPGPLDVSNCAATSKFGINTLQLFSKMEMFIHQKDQYGNLVPGLHEFDAQVLEVGTMLSMPVADLHFKEVAPGIQLFSFSVSEPGDFMLTIYDMKRNMSITNMPYEYTVFVGYCDGTSSIVNGSGFDSSVTGETAKFSVYLRDKYQYPSLVEVEKLKVQIVPKVDSIIVSPSIGRMQNGSGSLVESELRHGLGSVMGTIFAVADSINASVGNDEVEASSFDVQFTPIKSGVHEIIVFCGNVPLNGGHSIAKEVRAGEVNISLSRVVKFSSKVPKLIRNEIIVLLVDSFNNSVASQASRLKLEFAAVNSSAFSSWVFADNSGGFYSGQYLVEEVGVYEICVSFNGKHFLSCPMGINVYSSDYFPQAYDDSVSVWEEESIAFDILSNDYVASGNASLVEYSNPSHGSLLKYGQLFRYTPYKDFYGDDSFAYTISDVNSNFATGAVNICVLITPPQFVSFPDQLQATEDLVTPRFGGFPGFEMRYSDLVENISVTLSAQSGAVLLSPMLMQFWHPPWNGLSVKNGDGEVKELILEGTVEAINFALQSIQYLGNENFYGNDVIQISTINRSGKNSLNISVFVEPVNDPPIIRVPEFIMVKENNVDGSLIYDRGRDEFEFSVADPDLVNFPGGESRFMVTFSLEADIGLLVTNLPADLVKSTELKLRNSYQWQPLQTFVSISKRVRVKAKGVKFRGSVEDCNNIMQELFYVGEEHGAVLTVTLNDMGYYGRHPCCAENISLPLFAEATVNLIRQGPMNSLNNHAALGSAIVIEFVLVFSLGLLLLFFTCKCAIGLFNERRLHRAGSNKPFTAESSHKQSGNSLP